MYFDSSHVTHYSLALLFLLLFSVLLFLCLLPLGAFSAIHCLEDLTLDILDDGRTVVTVTLSHWALGGWSKP